MKQQEQNKENLITSYPDKPNNNKEGFTEWLSDIIGSVDYLGKDISREAWSHQQKKIDALEARELNLIECIKFTSMRPIGAASDYCFKCNTPEAMDHYLHDYSIGCMSCINDKSRRCLTELRI